MPGWMALLLGIVVLCLVFADRRDISAAWRRPARWWSRDPDEGFRSWAPSQPLNVVVGVILGICGSRLRHRDADHVGEVC